MKKGDFELSFEESLVENIEDSAEIVEIPLGDAIIRFLGFFVLFLSLLVLGRISYLSFADVSGYKARAESNLISREELPAPRGSIYDRYGKVLAENKPSFFIYLELKEFLGNRAAQRAILNALDEVVGIKATDVSRVLGEIDVTRSLNDRVLLATDITQSQAIRLKDLALPGLIVEAGFERIYNGGPAFGHVIGYLGRVNSQDLEKNPKLSYQSVIGRAGVEAFYNELLAGKSGVVSLRRGARNEAIGETSRTPPEIGTSLRLTIDAEFQSYVYNRMRDGLLALGRESGAAIAINPRSGEILSLVSFPSFDGNIFLKAGQDKEREALLNSPSKPLFNRAVSGLYSPGSTIKPLIGLAALSERVISPEKKIFSPGYLDVPNPYDPEHPTRFLDWRPHGYVDIVSAIAQSSNVYFYAVGGGFAEMRGLGVGRLREWFSKFRLDALSGVDLPGEKAGLLPEPDEHEKKYGRPWLLGDTYNLSIGQGEILVTPIGLLNYIAAIANGGKIYRPYINKAQGPLLLGEVEIADFALRKVHEGMRQAVISPLGTARLLSDLPFSVAAKTGTTQILKGKKENAFFVGYAPYDKPQIAILILVENSREGSLNTVPIAKDILNWYYWNRINGSVPESL